MIPGTVEVMGRQGRSRKAGRRHPSGQLVREKKPDDRVRTSRQPHRRGLPAEERLSEKAESPIGRMLLRGQLQRSTDPLHQASEKAELRYEASLRYAVIVGHYRATIEAPRVDAGGGRGFICGAVEGEFCDPEICICLRRKQRYDDAFAALSYTGGNAFTGHRAARAVARVAVQREEPQPQDIVHLLDGLDELVRHFGLTAARPRKHSRNAD